MIQERNVKPYAISRHLLMAAWEKVRSNRGSAGIDRVGIADFESNLKPLLYKVWNRMSSGSYFPSAVKLAEIPKSNGGGGGKCPLGIPTVADRVAQMVVVLTINPLAEPYFHADSYGYRPDPRFYKHSLGTKMVDVHGNAQTVTPGTDGNGSKLDTGW